MCLFQVRHSATRQGPQQDGHAEPRPQPRCPRLTRKPGVTVIKLFFFVDKLDRLFLTSLFDLASSEVTKNLKKK